MIEKSSLGIVEILLHIAIAAICLGILIASGVALSTTEDIYPDELPEDSHFKDDRETYDGVAGWLLFVSVIGIAVQSIMVMVRVFYFAEIIKINFLVFAVLNSAGSVIFTLCLLSGGIASAANANDVQDYIDALRCNSDYPLPDAWQGECDEIERLRDCQASSAALCFFGVAALGILLAILLISLVKKKQEAIAYKTVINE